MSDPDVRFSGQTNTMIAIALVASALSLALSVWSFSRVGELRAIMAVQMTHSSQPGGAGS